MSSAECFVFRNFRLFLHRCEPHVRPWLLEGCGLTGLLAMPHRSGLTCWHLVKCVLRAWGQLKRGFGVLAMCEMCPEGMGRVEKGV